MASNYICIQNGYPCHNWQWHRMPGYRTVWSNEECHTLVLTHYTLVFIVSKAKQGIPIDWDLFITQSHIWNHKTYMMMSTFKLYHYRNELLSFFYVAVVLNLRENMANWILIITFFLHLYVDSLLMVNIHANGSLL